MSDSGGSSRVLVVGAGIGGLTAAIALREVGLDVRVLERAPEIRPVGAGLSLWPNGLNALEALGLRDEVIASGRPATEMGFYTGDGRALGGSPVAGFADRYGAPLLLIHRGALQEVLLRRLGEGPLRLGAEVTGVARASEVGGADRGEGGVTVRLADGGSESAGWLVGADGFHSAVREAAFGDGPVRYAGFTAWRGIATPGPEVLEALRPGEYYGRGCLFGAGPLDAERVYWWASARIGQTESPYAPAVKESLLGRFEGWAEPLGALVVATPADAILRDLLRQRPPLPQMAAERVAMIGDAAHPMLPNLGQGAGQAIEDAVELAAAVATDPADLSGCLDHYNARRARRVAGIVRESARMARIGHLRNPLAAGLRNAMLRAVPESAIERRLDPVAGYEVAPPRRGFD